MKKGFTVYTNSTYTPPKYMFGTPDINLLSGSTLYSNLFTQRGSGSIEMQQEGVIPSALSISSLAIQLDIPPGTGESVTATLRKNGVDTLVSAIVSGAIATFAVDSTHSVTFAPGDLVSVGITATGGSGSTSAKISGLTSN